MSFYKEVSRTEPCPICGKDHWCSKRYEDTNKIIIFCRRYLHANDIISSIDGNTYTFISFAKDNSAMYQNKESRDLEKKEWLEQRRFPIKKNLQSKEVTSLSLPTPPPVINLIEPVCNYELDKVYRSFLAKLRLFNSHRSHLEREGWSRSLIMDSFIKSLPPVQQKRNFELSRERICTELLQEFGSLTGVPGFYKNSKSIWTFNGSSGFLIPLYDHVGNIYRLRIRLDHPVRGENGKEKSKYKNFSSYFEKTLPDGSLINSFTDGCRSGSHIGLYSNRNTDDFTVVYLTEGEKKSFYSNCSLGSPVISIPGVNSFHKLTELFDDGNNVLDYIAAKGCKILVIAFDADKAINDAVLMYEQKLIEFLQANFGFELALAYWNPGFGKGMDDILSMGVRPNHALVG